MAQKQMGKKRHAQNRWLSLSAEERAALPDEVRQQMWEALQRYLVKAAERNARKRKARYEKDEAEAWAEYAAREKADKLARAIRKLRARQ